MKRAWPWCTLALVAGGAAASAWPAGGERLVLTRDALDSGELWRVATAHFAHPTFELAALDLAALGVLGAWLERRSRATLVAAVIVGGALVDAAVWTLRDDLASYQGASGLASAAFVALALSLWRDGGVRRALALFALGVFAAKLGLEFRGATAGLVTSAGHEVVPEAHAAGALGGVLASLLGVVFRNRSSAGTHR
ncbi:MAG: rhombosortase [Planctomycetes bacterium]|nr:rhombosortase [Planctomycetota bacterium]